MRQLLIVWATLGLSSLLLFGGCAKREEAGAAKEAPATQQSMRRVKNNSQITDEEARALAVQVEKAVQTADAGALNTLIDYDVLLEIATEGISVSDKFRKEFSAGMQQGVRKNGGLGQRIVESASAQLGGSYEFLRSHESGKSKRILFRMLLPDSGVNYHDWTLERKEDGTLALADVYVFSLGEPLSQTFRRMYAAAAADASRGFLDRLTGSQQDYVKHMADIQRMTSLMQTQPAEVLAIYRKLPASLQKDRLVLGIRLLAAQAVDEQQYAAAIEEFRTTFPDDAATNLVLIDGYLLQKRYADSLAAIDSLEKAIGGDPYLNVLRGSVHVASGDLAAAHAAADAALAADPKLVSAYWLLVSLSLTEKQPAETLRLLTLLEKDHGLVMNDLAKSPDYADFVKSDEYQHWLAAHAEDAAEMEPVVGEPVEEGQALAEQPMEEKPVEERATEVKPTADQTPVEPPQAK